MTMFWRRKLRDALDKLNSYKKYITVDLHFYRCTEKNAIRDWKKLKKDLKLKLESIDNDDEDEMFYTSELNINGINVCITSPYFKNKKAIPKKVRCKIIKDNYSEIKSTMASILYRAWERGLIHVNDDVLEHEFGPDSKFWCGGFGYRSWKELKRERKVILDRRRMACEEK